MPLHSDHPIVRGLQLHPLDDAVCATRGDTQFLSWSFDRLVMTAVNLNLRGASQFLQMTAFGQRRAMLQVLAARTCREIGFTVCFGSGLLGRNVLHQRSAPMYVPDLAAVANRQHRLVLRERVLQNRAVGAIAIRVQSLGFRMPRLPVACRVYVCRTSR